MKGKQTESQGPPPVRDQEEGEDPAKYREEPYVFLDGNTVETPFNCWYL